LPQRPGQRKRAQGTLDRSPRRLQDSIVARTSRRDKDPHPPHLQGPVLGARGEARKREREARLAEALRANLRRRKSDLDHRSGPAGKPASKDEDG
jgi:hypothetical protein